MHPGAGDELVTRRAALDKVGGERERPTRDADDRSRVPELAPYERDGLEHEAKVRLRIDRPEAADTGTIADRFEDDRPVRGELEPHAHRLDRQHHVGEQHRGVGPERDRSSGADLGAQLGRPGDVHDRVVRAQLEVARQPPAGLAHEPDRRRIHALTTARREKPIATGHRRGYPLDLTLVHEIDEPAQVVGIGRRQHAMPEVEDVTRPATGLLQHPAGLSLGGIPRSRQQRGIQIALDGSIGNPGPSIGQLEPPVEPDDVATGLGHGLEQAAA